jgi:hypothetical protein
VGLGGALKNVTECLLGMYQFLLRTYFFARRGRKG